MPSLKTPKLSASYVQLVLNFPLRPISSERQYKRALKTSSDLLARGKLSAAQADYVSVLVDIIARFENATSKQLDSSFVSASDLVRHLLFERGQSVNSLAGEVRMSQGTLNDMMNGRRKWSNGAISAISSHLNIGTDIFFRTSSSPKKSAA